MKSIAGAICILAAAIVVAAKAPSDMAGFFGISAIVTGLLLIVFDAIGNRPAPPPQA